MSKRVVASATAAMLMLGGVAAFAQEAGGPPEDVLDRAYGAAAEAHRVAKGLEKEKNPNSAAGLSKEEKVARKAAHFQALADKLADRGTGHASAVLQALAEGRSPSELAGLNADAAKAMAAANKALRDEAKAAKGTDDADDDASEPDDADDHADDDASEPDDADDDASEPDDAD